MENVRTYKLFIILTVFLLFGLMSPLIAKITPQLLDSLMPKGMNITISEPTAFDSWAQFFKNISQMGFIVVVILFSGTMANEFSKGTLINILTKGLHRSTVILSKWVVIAALWTFSLIGSFLVTYAYTEFLWDTTGIRNLFFSLFCLWLFGILLLAILILGGTIGRNSYSTLLFCGIFVALLMIINIVPAWQDYNPLSLASNNMPLLTGDISVSDMAKPIIIAIALCIVSVASAVGIFRKKQL